MGAWGHKPFENDSALDWLAYIERPILREITFALRPDGEGGGYHETIAAAALLVQMTGRRSIPDLSYLAFQEDTFSQAIAALERIRQDKSWMKTWESPACVRRRIGALISQLGVRAKEEAEQENKIKITFGGRRKAGTRIYHCVRVPGGRKTNKNRRVRV
jgi:hypothetical protein